MDDTPYGVVVERFPQGFGIWLLFKGFDCHLTKLYDENLGMGDVVQSINNDQGHRIRHCPNLRQNVWSDNNRVIIRTIISTWESKTYREKCSNDEFVLLVSRDLGYVAVPISWYDREVANSDKLHFYAFAEYRGTQLMETRTTRELVFWRIIDNRVSISVDVAKIRTPHEFNLPYEMSGLDAIVVGCTSSRVLLWACALSGHVVYADASDRLAYGEWFTVALRRTNDEEYRMSKCEYSVVDYTPSRRQFDSTIQEDRIMMTLSISKSESARESCSTSLRLASNGFPVRYENVLFEWISYEKRIFDAVVQVTLMDDGYMDLKAVSPVARNRNQSLLKAPREISSESKCMDNMEKAMKDFRLTHRNDRGRDNDEADRPNDGGSRNNSDGYSSIGAESYEMKLRRSDDLEAEVYWRSDMEGNGWTFPENLNARLESEDRCMSRSIDSNESASCQEPAPVSLTKGALSQRSRLFREGLSAKAVFCLVAGIVYADVAMTIPEKIELFVLAPGTPSYIVHNIKNLYHITCDSTLITIGNIIEIMVKRGYSEYEVFDEQWRKSGMKLTKPWREVTKSEQWRKHIELIVEARCLSQDAQDRFNSYHRYNNKGFVMLVDDGFLHNVAHFGGELDARRDHGCTFQMTVIPDECLEGHVFWQATVIHSMTERAPDWDDPSENMEEREKPPAPIERICPKNELKTTLKFYNYDPQGNPVTVAREARMEEILALYERIIENDKLTGTLQARTGFNYKKKLMDAREIALTTLPHQKSMKRELQVNSDLLISIVENCYSEEIFRACGERRLFKMLVKTSQGVKAFRSTVNNR